MGQYCGATLYLSNYENHYCQKFTVGCSKNKISNRIVYLVACARCTVQMVKHVTSMTLRPHLPVSELGSWPGTTQPWQRIYVDF